MCLRLDKTTLARELNFISCCECFGNSLQRNGSLNLFTWDSFDFLFMSQLFLVNQNHQLKNRTSLVVFLILKKRNGS